MKRLLVALMCLAVIITGGCRQEDKMPLGLYVADSNNERVVILDTDLNYVDSFSVEGKPNGIAVDANYIYVSLNDPYKLCKYNKAPPYGLVDSNSAGYNAINLAVDNVYVYFPEYETGAGEEVEIYKKSDLSFYDKFDTEEGRVWGLVIDDNYIYTSDFTNNVDKWNKSTYAHIDTIIENNSPASLAIDDTYLYVQCSDDESIKLFKLSDLSLYKSISPGYYPNGIAINGEFIFVGGYSSDKVCKINIGTEEIVGTYSELDGPKGLAIGSIEVGPPSKPTELLCNGQTNPVDVIPLYFSAVYHGGYTGKHYQIQVNKNSSFTGRMVWDSGKTAMSDVTGGDRCANIDYNGQALSLNKIKYYWRIKFWDSEGDDSGWSDLANFTMAGSGAGEEGAGPWEEDTLEPSGEVKVEIPRRSGQWTTLEDIMRIHTNINKNPLDAMELAQTEVTCCNISKNFNSYEVASAWYKALEGYAVQVSVGCKVGGTPISRKLFTGIISSVNVTRLNQTAEIRIVDFLDYFGRVTIKETPVWQGISLTQLYKNLVELAFSDWVEGVDYFVEDLGGSTIPAIGYENLNLLSELKSIAESRGMRIFTDVNGKLVCRSRAVEGEPWDIKHDYNLEGVVERRDIDGVINWVVVHARPHEIVPDVTPPGKVAGFTATPADQKIDLSWSNPTDDDFLKVKIQFSTTAYPTNPGNGANIYEGTGESKEHTGLTNGVRYYYSAFTVDDVGNWSDAAQTSAVAGAGGGTWGDDTGTSSVSGFRADPGSEVIILTWQNPNIANFDYVTIRRSDSGYPSTPTSGSQVYQGTRETTTDTGLDNGKRYYYSAFAKNTAGKWSGAAFASAVPDGARVVLDTQSITYKRCIKYDTTYEVWLPCQYYGNSWSGTRICRLSDVDKRSSGWLRFRHEWDIKITSGSEHPDSEKHVRGANDDLSLSFSHDCGGVARVSVTLITVTSSYVKIQYKIVYTGGMARRIEVNNKLYLMG